MKKVYVAKVLVILGGFRNQSEYDLAVKAFEDGLSPQQAANRIINQR